MAKFRWTDNKSQPLPNWIRRSFFCPPRLRHLEHTHKNDDLLDWRDIWHIWRRDSELTRTGLSHLLHTSLRPIIGISWHFLLTWVHPLSFYLCVGIPQSTIILPYPRICNNFHFSKSSSEALTPFLRNETNRISIHTDSWGLTDFLTSIDRVWETFNSGGQSW